MRRVLPRPGSLDQLDQLPCPGWHRRAPARLRKLARPADERKADGHRFGRPRDRHPADGDRFHRLGLALDHERWERLDREVRRECSITATRREDGARRSRGHEPRRDVHHVAHDGVRPPERRPDVAGEQWAAVHADP
jgi:hypothetical protein